MPRPAKSRAFPPLTLLSTSDDCPVCRQATTVFALVADVLYDAAEEDTFTGPLLLQHVDGLPRRLLAYFEKCCPGWRPDREEAGELPYLMNHCAHCGARLTDYHLHAEPGSAFFPASPEECTGIRLLAVPATDSVPLACGFSSGGLTDWLDFEKLK
jgi:hypothetical protein